MRAQVQAMAPEDFEAWAVRKRAQIVAAGEALAEQRKLREREGQTD